MKIETVETPKVAYIPPLPLEPVQEFRLKIFFEVDDGLFFSTPKKL